MEYTKGEWKAKFNKGKGKYEIYADTGKDTAYHIATINQEANAHLISAAPLLYEALKDWIEYQDEWGNFVPPNARQALAKVDNPSAL